MTLSTWCDTGNYCSCQNCCTRQDLIENPFCDKRSNCDPKGPFVLWPLKTHDDWNWFIWIDITHHVDNNNNNWISVFSEEERRISDKLEMAGKAWNTKILFGKFISVTKLKCFSDQLLQVLHFRQEREAFTSCSGRFCKATDIW